MARIPGRTVIGTDHGGASVLNKMLHETISGRRGSGQQVSATDVHDGRDGIGHPGGPDEADVDPAGMLAIDHRPFLVVGVDDGPVFVNGVGGRFVPMLSSVVVAAVVFVAPGGTAEDGAHRGIECTRCHVLVGHRIPSHSDALPCRTNTSTVIGHVTGGTGSSPHTGFLPGHTTRVPLAGSAECGIQWVALPASGDDRGADARNDRQVRFLHSLAGQTGPSVS